MAAGMKCSMVIDKWNKMKWCGSNKTIKYLDSFESVSMSYKLKDIENYIPINIKTSWS